MLVGVDVCLIAAGCATLSSQITYLNQKSGWLLALAIAALWLHWFFVPLIGRG